MGQCAPGGMKLLLRSRGDFWKKCVVRPKNPQISLLSVDLLCNTEERENGCWCDCIILSLKFGFLMGSNALLSDEVFVVIPNIKLEKKQQYKKSQVLLLENETEYCPNVVLYKYVSLFP